MSLDSVRADLALRAPDIEILEAPGSTATVALAAQAWGIEPGRIAKTLSLRVNDRALLVVAAGDRRLDNRKIRQTFGGKGRMLDADEVLALTGHPVGGVCPFGLSTPLPVFCDQSLRAWDLVVPAAGSHNSALRISPQRLAALVGDQWVDVCQDLPTAAAAAAATTDPGRGDDDGRHRREDTGPSRREDTAPSRRDANALFRRDDEDRCAAPGAGCPGGGARPQSEKNR